jgi:hypothetical protein
MGTVMGLLLKACGKLEETVAKLVEPFAEELTSIAAISNPIGFT